MIQIKVPFLSRKSSRQQIDKAEATVLGGLTQQLRSSPYASLLDDLSSQPDSGTYATGVLHFEEFLRLIAPNPNITLILDEAQNLRHMLFLDPIRNTIDDFHHSAGGTIVVAGSHQQQMHDILGPKGELFQRFYNVIHLNPLSPVELFEMGAKQGWLDRPCRFHTMYSVLGGIPRNWERFHQQQLSGEFIDPVGASWSNKGDIEWCNAFILHRLNDLRLNPDSSFLNPEFFDLREEAKMVFDSLSGKYSGKKEQSIINDIQREIKKEEERKGAKQEIITELKKKDYLAELEKSEFDSFVQRRFDFDTEKIAKKYFEIGKFTLASLLRIAEYSYRPSDNKDFKLYISEPSLAFEKSTFDLWNDESAPITETELKTILAAVDEGFTFELFMKQYVRTYSDLRRVSHSVMVPQMGDQPATEIDLVVEAAPPKQGTKPVLYLLECKCSLVPSKVPDVWKSMQSYMNHRMKNNREDIGKYEQRFRLVVPDTYGETIEHDQLQLIDLKKLFSLHPDLPEINSWPTNISNEPQFEPNMGV